MLTARSQESDKILGLQLGADDYVTKPFSINELLARVPMSALEFSVMRYLITRRGDVVSREQLLNDVWGSKAFPTTRSVDNLIARLRQKLETEPRDPSYLVTVHGVGYKFVD